MRTFVLGFLLPVMVAVGAWWAIGDDVPPRETAAPMSRQVPTLVTADSSGNGHDGTVQGDIEMGLPGRRASSFSFSQRGAWVQVPSAPDLNPGSSDFYLSAWINLEETPGARETYDLVRKGIAYTIPGEYKLEILHHGWVRCSAKDASQRLAVAINQTVVTDGNWHLVGCARVGPFWSAVVDDTLASSEVELQTVENTVALSIGSKYGLEDRPYGRVDNVKIILGGPSAASAEVSRNDLPGLIRTMRQQEPTAWWRLDEMQSSPVGR